VLRDPNYLEARVESDDVTGLVVTLTAAKGPDGSPADHPCHPTAFSLDGRVLASGSGRRECSVWDRGTGQGVVCFAAYERGVGRASNGSSRGGYPDASWQGVFHGQ
jgi:hypothetical protein